VKTWEKDERGEEERVDGHASYFVVGSDIVVLSSSGVVVKNWGRHADKRQSVVLILSKPGLTSWKYYINALR
jgi:hypothetical protein